MRSIKSVDEFGNIRYRNEDGLYHREDGPAYESYKKLNGVKMWLINGKFHREDGPAIERTKGHLEWYINGKRHREDGPAIIFSNGETSYYLNNNYYNKEDWEQLLVKRKLERLKDL